MHGLPWHVRMSHKVGPGLPHFLNEAWADVSSHCVHLHVSLYGLHKGESRNPQEKRIEPAQAKPAQHKMPETLPIGGNVLQPTGAPGDKVHI